MREERIQQLQISILATERAKLKFGIIAIGQLGEIPQSDVDRKVRAYIQFHIAIAPDVPVIMFEINGYADTGSPVFSNEACTLFHLPPYLYPRLDEIVADKAFLVSEELLKEIINNRQAYNSIFEILAKKHQETGLVAIGIPGESPHADKTNEV